MLRRTASILTGSVALLVIVLASLVLVAPAQAAERCDTLTAGTQAYAECMVRDADRRSGYGANFSQPQQTTPTPQNTRVVEVSSIEVWQLVVAGVVGAAGALGLTIGISQLAQRRHATALR